MSHIFLLRIVFEGPDYFFKGLEKEGDKLVKWVGELYLELHNGTYTSQVVSNVFVLVSRKTVATTYFSLRRQKLSGTIASANFSFVKWSI